MFYKKRRKRRTYQTKFNVSKVQKINKNKVTPSSPTSTNETNQTSDTHQDKIYLNNETNTLLSDEKKIEKLRIQWNQIKKLFAKESVKEEHTKKKLNINKLHKINKNKIVSS